MAHHREAFVAFDTAKLRNAVAIADAGRNGEVRYLGEIDRRANSRGKDKIGEDEGTGEQQNNAEEGIDPPGFLLGFACWVDGHRGKPCHRGPPMDGDQFRII